jgi:hypothetical protein
MSKADDDATAMARRAAPMVFQRLIELIGGADPHVTELAIRAIVGHVCAGNLILDADKLSADDRRFLREIFDQLIPRNIH